MDHEIKLNIFGNLGIPLDLYYLKIIGNRYAISN